jgi:7,8-dihydropterin-6-yl-methyl-4-(beta-D-ribofuranosyl)aminobenzene 5'-phosphate synthase
MVEGPEKTILFDTGGEGDVLMANMEALGLDPRKVDVVVLSHAHRDHTGGLKEFLKANPDVVVYVPQSFDEGFKRRASDSASRVVEIDQTTSICENVYSTGEMGYSIKEQGLIVRTRRGIIVVTGCAHPGIVSMVERAASHDDEVLLVIGGFHLVRAGKAELAEVVRGLKNAGVRYAAPSHCSGDMAREVFHEEFGSRYIEVGVGRFINAQDLD